MPDNTVPDNTAPDNTAPDSTAPDNTAPDNTAPDASPDSLEALYRAAQLVTTTPKEAERLVRRAVDSASMSASSDPAEVMAEELAALHHRPGTGLFAHDAAGIGVDSPAAPEPADTVMRAVLRRDIDRVIPDALSVLEPARRIRLAAAVWQARDAESGSGESGLAARQPATEAFVRLVRARLPWRRTSLTDDEYRAIILDVLQSFVEQYTEPASPVLEASMRDDTRRSPDEESIEESADRFLQRSRRFAAGLLLVVVAALLGTWLSTADFQSEERPAPRLFDVVMEMVDRPADFVLQTGDSGQAERYVRDRFGWNIVAPRIDGAALQGVESEEPVAGYDLPVLRYAQSGSAPDVRVIVIPYSVIQRMRGEVVVDRAVLNQVADAGSFDVVQTESALRVAWRHLDDVYVALVSSATAGFEDRISMP